jgi:hypothetical protein
VQPIGSRSRTDDEYAQRPWGRCFARHTQNPNTACSVTALKVTFHEPLGKHP